MSAAKASAWVPVGGTVGADIFIDQSSIRFNSARAKAWFMDNYKTPTQVPAVFPVKFASSAKELYVFDCDQGTYGVVQTIYTSGSNGDGEVLGSWSTAPVNIQMADVVPDSVGEVMLKLVCQYRSPKKSKPM